MNGADVYEDPGWKLTKLICTTIGKLGIPHDVRAERSRIHLSSKPDRQTKIKLIFEVLMLSVCCFNILLIAKGCGNAYGFYNFVGLLFTADLATVPRNLA